MASSLTRRGFLRAAAAAPVLGLTDLSKLLPLSPASAADATITPDLVRHTDHVDDLVRLIEHTPPERSVEVAVERLRAGVPYRQLLAATFLAAIRTNNGHSVYVVNSAHQLGLDAAHEERLLPLLWAVNNSAGRGLVEDGLLALDPLGDRVLAADAALGELHAGMDALDIDRAERAAVALSRAGQHLPLFEALWRYGTLNCQSVYHSSISLASGWRTLETIGWRHAEPMLRFFVRDCIAPYPKAKLIHRGDWTYLPNRERSGRWAAKLAAGWAGDSRDAGLTLELLALIREFKADEACELAATRLADGKAQAGAVWDAVHLAAGELLMRKQDAAYPVHVNTGANALHYGFRNVADSETRLLILLQGLGWQCHARRRLAEVAAADPRGKLGDAKIDELVPAEIPERPEDAAADLFASVNRDLPAARSKAFAFGSREPDGEAFRRAAYRLLLTKLKSPQFPNGDVHDFKFPPAIFEDLTLVDPRWRPHLLAAAAHWLPGSDSPDSPVLLRAREAVRTL